MTIPRGSPIDLNLQMTMGKSEVDLGGLTLGEVSVTAAMGEHSIDFHEPVVEGLRELRISTSMGKLALENLGNARAESIHASGNMGEVTANLGGAWPAGGTVQPQLRSVDGRADAAGAQQCPPRRRRAQLAGR